MIGINFTTPLPASVEVSLRWLQMGVQQIKGLVIQNGVRTHKTKQGHLYSGEILGPANQNLRPYSATRGCSTQRGTREPSTHNAHHRHSASKACQIALKNGRKILFQTKLPQWICRRGAVGLPISFTSRTPEPSFQRTYF